MNTLCCSWRAARPGDAFDRQLANLRHAFQFFTFSGILKSERLYQSLFFAGICVLFATCWNFVDANLRTSNIDKLLLDGSEENFSGLPNMKGHPLLEFECAKKIVNRSVLKSTSHDPQPQGTGPALRMVENSTYLGMPTSDWQWTPKSARFGSSSMVPRERMTYDSRPPWPWYLEHFLVSFLFGVGLAGAGIRGKHCSFSASKRAAICGCVLLTAVYAVAAAGYASLGHLRETYFAAGQTLVWVLTLLALIFASGFFEEVLAILVVAALLARAVSDCLIFRDSQKLAAMPPTVQVALMILSCSLVAYKYRQLVHIVRCMEPERARYKAAWQQILAREGALVELRRLEELTLQAAGPPFLQRRFC